MANQMIALGVRGPQLPNLATTAQQYGNVMANTAIAKEKQASIARANAFRQLVSSPDFDASNPQHLKAAQALDPEGAAQLATTSSNRRKADLEYIGEQTKMFRDQLAMIDPADKQGYALFRDEVIKVVPGWASRLPTPEQWDARTRVRVLMQADDVINKTIPTPNASVQQDASGNFYGVTVGGMGTPTAAPVTVVPNAPPPPPRTGQVTVEPSVTVEPGMGGPYQPAGNPQARDIARILANVQDDNEYQATLAIVDRAAPELARQIRQVAPRFDPQALQTIIGAAEQAFGGPVARAPEGLVTGERGGVGGPYEPAQPGVQLRGKPPMQSPMPGSAIVPLPRVGAEAAAGEGGKQGVRVITEPKIAGGSKAAELRAQRDDDYPEATGRMKANLARIDNIIETAKDLKRHPAYRRIIGPIDAFTPNITGGARGAQSLFTTLKDMGAIDELQKMRSESKTGGAVGNASDADIKLLSNAFGALDQSQDEEDFDKSLTAVINRAMQTRQRIVDQYRDTYSYRLPKTWSPPAITRTRPQPQRKETKVGQFIVSEE